MKFRSFSPFRCASLAALIALTVVLALNFYKFHGQVTGFFRIGSEMPLSPYLNANEVFIHKGKIGNDGQQFLTIALDPTLSNPGSLKALDLPAYRYRRILYPLLGSILGLGNPTLVPWALVLINVMSLVGMVFILALLFRKHGQRTWYSLFVLCIPGVWMTLSIATADLLNGVILLSAVYFYDQKKEFLTAAMLCLACLAREASLLFFAAFVLDALLAKRWRCVLGYGLAAIPVVVWNFYALFSMSHNVENSIQSVNGSANIHFTYPFFGLVSKIFQLLNGSKSAQNLYDAGSFILLLSVAFLLLLQGRRVWETARGVVFCGLFSLVLLFIASMQILNHFVDYSRVYLALPLLLLAGTAWIPHTPALNSQNAAHWRLPLLLWLPRFVAAAAGAASFAYLLSFALEFRGL